MSFSHDVRHTVSVGGETVPSPSKRTYTGSGMASVSELIAVGTDALVNISLDVSAVTSIIIWSDRAITVETNAADHSGGNILSLTAGVPYMWCTDSYDTFKLTADVTKLYITNASGASAQLEVRAIQDATP